MKNLKINDVRRRQVLLNEKFAIFTIDHNQICCCRHHHLVSLYLSAAATTKTTIRITSLLSTTISRFLWFLIVRLYQQVNLHLLVPQTTATITTTVIA